MISKFKKWLLKKDSEGISYLQVFSLLLIFISMEWMLINLTLWLTQPEQSWIRQHLFPFG